QKNYRKRGFQGLFVVKKVQQRAASLLRKRPVKSHEQVLSSCRSGPTGDRRLSSTPPQRSPVRGAPTALLPMVGATGGAPVRDEGARPWSGGRRRSRSGGRWNR